MPAVTADEYPELISDDPRMDCPKMGTIQELKQWRRLIKERGGLVSQSQIANLAGVNPSTITSKVKRGQFTTYTLFGLKCVPMDEVIIYLDQRNTEEQAKGGRGLKAPNYWELLKSAGE